MTTQTQITALDDPFLALLDELRDSIDSLETDLCVATLSDNSQESLNCLLKMSKTVDTLAVAITTLQNNTDPQHGFIHVSKCMPINTINDDVRYIGINQQGYACVFNYIDERGHCIYLSAEESIDLMSDLVWWKVLIPPNNSSAEHALLSDTGDEQPWN